MARSSAWIFVILVSFGLGMVELSNRGEDPSCMRKRGVQGGVAE